MLSKLHFECPEEQLQGKIPSEETHKFCCQFRILSWPFSADCRKFFGMVVKTASYVSRGRFYWEVSLTFYLLKTNVFWQKVFARFSKLRSQCPEEQFEGNSVYTEKNLSNLHHLRTLGRKNFGIWHKLPGRFVEIAYYASSGKLKEKPVLEKTAFLFSFSNSERFFWRKNVGRVHHNYLLNVRRKISRKWMFLKKFMFLLSFSDIGWKTFGFLSKTTRKLSQNASYLCRGKFQEEIFLTSSLFHLVPNVGKKFRPLVGKTSSVLSKLQSTCL